MIELDESSLSGWIFVDSCLFVSAYGSRQEENSELARKLLRYAVEHKKLFVPAPVIAEILSHQNTDSARKALEQLTDSEGVFILAFDFEAAILFADASFCERIPGKTKHCMKYDKMIVACVKKIFSRERGDIFLTLDEGARRFAIQNGITAPQIHELTAAQRILHFPESQH